MTSTRRTGLLLALATAGISGFSVYVNASGVKAVGDPTVYTTLKNAVAFLLLAGLAAAVAAAGRPGRATLDRPATGRQWVGLGVVGLLGGAAAFVLFFEGLSRATSAQAAFLHKTLLLWVALLAVPLLGERVTGWHALAMVALVAGQAGLVGGVVTSLGTGEAMVLGATLLWAVEVVVAKRLLADLSSWTVGLARMGIGAVALLGWTAWRSGLSGLTVLTAEQWGWVLLTGLLLTGYVATWYAALARAQAVDVTAVLVVGAVVTALLSAGIDGTALAPQAGWLLLVLAGGALVAVPMVRREVPAS